MFPLAHIGYTFLAAEIVTHLYYWIFLKKRDLRETDSWGIRYFIVIPLLIGSVGPDIIDKLISLPITGYGRYIAHSLVFDIGIVLVILAIFRKHKLIAFSFIFGWQMHLLLDIGGFLPWFFPIINYDFQPMTETYIERLFDPYVYYNEIAGVFSLVFLLVLYLSRKFTLKTLLKETLRFDRNIA